MGRFACLLLALLLLAAPRAWAHELEQRTVLTVSGAIGQSNRGPYEPFVDLMAGKWVPDFKRAYAFSDATLAELEQRRLTLNYEAWDGKPHDLVGPALGDVLRRVGATGERITVVGLDGYAVEFTRDVVEQSGMILARTLDGELLAIGGAGPLWLVFAPGSVPELQDAGDQGLAWAVFHIVVE